MYALQKTVKELGAEAEIIDYACPRISDCYQEFPLRALVHPRLFWHAILNYKEQSHRNQKFEQFEKKHMTFSEKLGKKALSHVQTAMMRTLWGAIRCGIHSLRVGTAPIFWTL